MKKLADLYEKVIGNEYRKEGKQFVLSKAKNILHIGCGAYPITAMILAEMYDAKVTTIDNDAKAIKYANKVLSNKNLNGKVRAEHGDGTKYLLDGFDTIIISGCSVPKLKVLDHVLKTAQPQSKIIVRDSILDIESMINSMKPDHNFRIIETISSHPFPTSYWQSYYLIKNS